MGLGEFLDYESRIRKAVDGALEKNIHKAEERTKAVLDDAQQRLRSEIDAGAEKLHARGNDLLENAQARVRAATDQFFGDLEKRWEKRLEQETRAQFKLLNRVLLYTLAVAALSFAYAVARAKLGW
jgi:vacuolar-type H+-ATPase subunit H